MKSVFRFEGLPTPAVAAGLRSGLIAFATNTPTLGPPSTLWLKLGDGNIFRVGVKMHDLLDWEEIGTLTFEVVGGTDAPEMVCLPGTWLHVREVQKLLYVSDECEAESGFSLCTISGESLTVLPGADVYTLAIDASFYEKSFTPENDLPVYFRKDF